MAYTHCITLSAKDAEKRFLSIVAAETRVMELRAEAEALSFDTDPQVKAYAQDKLANAKQMEALIAQILRS